MPGPSSSALDAPLLGWRLRRCPCSCTRCAVTVECSYLSMVGLCQLTTDFEAHKGEPVSLSSSGHLQVRGSAGAGMSKGLHATLPVLL